MKVLLFLCLSAALLCSVVFAHHGGEHDDDSNDHHGNDKGGSHKNDLQRKGKHHKHHHHHHHHHTNESMDCHKIARPNAYFAFKFFNQLAAAQPLQNIFFSPVSISIAFAMLSEGAKGETHDQILGGLGFNKSEITEDEIHSGYKHLLQILNDPDSELQLSSGNALFIDKNLKVLQSFLDDVKKNYEAEAFSTDFEKSDEAKQQINSYVERKTNGKIAELVSSVAKESVLVLTNYIYFRGKWDKPFEEKHTKEGDFHVDEKTVVKVPFMYRTGRYYASLSENYTVVEIPYKGDASAIFILPKDGNFKHVEGIFQKSAFKGWRSKLHFQSLNLLLPKLSLSTTLDLKKELSQLGITDVFSDNSNLSGITEGAKLKVSKAVHKAVLSMDEKGTEAAGATAVEIMPMSLPPTVAFDRPYLFLIQKTNAKSVLFLGKVANPVAK